MKVGSTSGGTASADQGAGGGPKPEKRESRAPKKSDEAAKAGGTIGELIKQKLGAQLGMEKKDEKGEKDEAGEEDKDDE
jgi:hypothetical protein